MTDIELEPVDLNNKGLIDNLWQYYELESSFWSKEDVDAAGRFASLEGFLARVGQPDSFDSGFIIKYQSQIAGFLIVSDEFLFGKPIREFSDIYVLPKYRGLGITSEVIRLTILKSDRPWMICVFRNDHNAQAFWRKAFARLPFSAIYENNPPEVGHFHEYIVNDPTGIHCHHER